MAKRRSYSAARKAYRKVRKYKVSKYTKPATAQGSPKIHMVNLGYLLPDKVKIQLPYVESIVTLASQATPYEYVYSGNDIFDPNQTGTGHSAMLLDQFAVFYKYYLVRSSTMSVKSVPSSTGAFTGSCRIITIPTEDSAALTLTYLPRTIEENEESKVKNMGNANTNPFASSRHYMSTRKQLGAMSDGDFAGTTDGSVAPPNEWYWHLIIASGDDAAAINLAYQTKIVYSIEFDTKRIVNYS